MAIVRCLCPSGLVLPRIHSMDAIKRISVYIADDSDSIRGRLVAMLATMDNIHIVGEARTAAEAIAGIVSVRPNIVLLDLNLAGTSGMDVLRAVVPELPDMHVIVLTNHAEPQYRRACLKAGARDFLDKSTQFDSVKAVIAGLGANGTGK